MGVIDHDAMMWCHQLRRQIATALLNVLGRDVDGRMEVFRKVFSGTQTLSDSVQGFNDVEVTALELGMHQKLDAGLYYGKNVQILTSHTVSQESSLESYEMLSGSIDLLRGMHRYLGRIAKYLGYGRAHCSIKLSQKSLNLKNISLIQRP